MCIRDRYISFQNLTGEACYILQFLVDFWFVLFLLGFLCNVFSVLYCVFSSMGFLFVCLFFEFFLFAWLFCVGFFCGFLVVVFLFVVFFVFCFMPLISIVVFSTRNLNDRGGVLEYLNI